VAGAVTRPEPSGARGVLLLGMHRSGTSALAGALAELGLWLGGEDALLPAHPQDNPGGYFERGDIHDAHVEFLAASGHDWDRLAGFHVADPDGPAARALRRRLAPTLAELAQHAPWLLKDPRLSVLLPVWDGLVPGAVPVVAVRHPVEIAGSLQDTPRGRYPTPFLLLLWQKYMARMLADLAGRRAIFVDYHRMLAQPAAQMARIARLLAQAGVAGLRPLDDQAARDRFDPGLHRQQVDADGVALMTAQQQRLFDWLQAAAAADDAVLVEGADWPEPDRRLAEFEASFDQRLERGREQAAGESLRALARLETRAAEQQAQLGEAVVQIGRFSDEMATLRAEGARLAAQLALDNRALGAARTDLAQARTALARSEAELKRIGEILEPTRTHVRNLESAIAHLHRSWSWRATAPLRALPALLRPRLSGSMEQRLYRLYYKLPLLSGERKRRLVVWVHEHLPFITRNTQSYAIWKGAFAGAGEPGDPAAGSRRPRIDAATARERIGRLSRQPLVSVLMPTWNTDPAWLDAAIGSLRKQFYPNWQLCIADDASTRPETLAYLKALDEPRIKVVFLAHNRGISAASNAALELATGEYVGLLDHDDELSADALLESVAALVGGELDLVYSDEDKIDVSGRHGDPHFKPGLSPDMLLSQNYVCHFLVARRALFEEVGGFRSGFDGAQDHDLLLRLTEHAQRVQRIPLVLYHWRMHGASTAANPGAKPASWKAGLAAVTEAIGRRGIAGQVEFGPYPHTYRVRRALKGRPLVSIIIPFRDKPQLLETCIDSVLERTGYDNFEILCIDNGSVEPATADLLRRLTAADRRVRAIRHDVPFNYSVINNFGASKARGEHLLLLNNDTEVIEGQWLEALLEHSQRPEVGVVGARLLYEDDSVQHAGVIAGLGGVAGHSHLNVPRDAPGYFSRQHLIQDLSAVTFACAMTRREVFERLGGLNEGQLTIAFNDVDYCLRARELGFRVIYTPYALLYHYESKSRGYEDSPLKQARFGAEIRYMQTRHRAILAAGDPWYNPNFPLDRESFAVDLRYRDELP
jgi:GT2 family glycosyltransferase